MKKRFEVTTRISFMTFAKSEKQAIKNLGDFLEKANGEPKVFRIGDIITAYTNIKKYTKVEEWPF